MSHHPAMPGTVGTPRILKTKTSRRFVVATSARDVDYRRVLDDGSHGTLMSCRLSAWDAWVRKHRVEFLQPPGTDDVISGLRSRFDDLIRILESVGGTSLPDLKNDVDALQHPRKKDLARSIREALAQVKLASGDLERGRRLLGQPTSKHAGTDSGSREPTGSARRKRGTAKS
jgi:hypothetical protein